jgi:hypothetical protein
MQAVFKLEASKPDGTMYRMEFTLGLASLGWLLMKLLP